jgi:translocation and assembly module TamB
MVFKISVRGEDFMAARTPIISLTLSPDLLLSTEGDLFNLTGTVRIPEATFKPIEVTSMNTLSPDVVVVDAGVPSSSGSSPGIRGDLTFILEDKVHFEGFGLTGRVSGSVRIIEEPGKLLSATGDLTIADGQYRAYGQKLNIERGRIIFSGGPVDNPGLDIRAVRRSGEILAGVQVGGTIMAPEVSLFSEPPMDQADALSYLLLGKPLRRASGDEGQVLAAAALTMGLTRGEALAARIGRSFGFEEVTVQTESDVEESAIVVGRYLTPRVYVRYGIGLFQAFNIFQFGYRISDRFLLQGESGVQTGTDLFYTIEK